MSSAKKLDPALLSNIEVAEFLRDVIFYEVPFLGVFPVDKIPYKSLVKQNFWSIIVNLDKHTEPGSHFVAVARNPNGRFFYFASLALPSSSRPKSLTTFLSDIQKENEVMPLWEIEKPIQALDSTACGYFTIFFVLVWHFCDVTYKDLDTLCHKLGREKDLSKNDLYVYKSIRELISKYVSEKTSVLRNLHLEKLPLWPKIQCHHSSNLSAKTKRKEDEKEEEKEE